MRSAFLFGIPALLLALYGCGGDDVELPPGGTGTGTGTSSSSGSGTGGDTGSSSSSSSTTTGTGGSGGGAACPGFGDPCTNCASASCEAQYCDCFNNSTCVDLVLCIQGCQPGDLNCQKTCFTDNEAGISDSVILTDCIFDQCNGATECNGVGQDLGACELCLFTNCDTEMNTCLANPECYEIILCIQAAPQPCDAACQQGCALQHTGGITDIQPVAACGNPGGACETECMMMP